jgi:DNA polymerase-3 subunit delta'
MSVAVDEIEAPPEPDAAPGAPHPRHTLRLYGQAAAEQAFLSAYGSGRMHHGWLLTGPRGVGKATLAWRIARFLLAHPPQAEDGLFGAPAAPETLEVDPEGVAARQAAALSHPNLYLLRRAWDRDRKRHKAVIDVEEARGMKRFLQKSASDGGRRVVVVDAADDLNPSAANAILKVLEEPPPNTAFLLVAHAPARLLPTIRSRCRSLPCRPLAMTDLEAALTQAGHPPGGDLATLSELAEGSAGAALRLLTLGGPEIYGALVRLLAAAPQMDRPAALALAETLGARGKEEETELAIRLAETLMARLARAGTGHPPGVEAVPGEAELLARLAPGPDAARGWAALQQLIGQRMRQGRAINLDPQALVLDMVLKMNEAAANLAAR